MCAHIKYPQTGHTHTHTHTCTHTHTHKHTQDEGWDKEGGRVRGVEGEGEAWAQRRGKGRRHGCCSLAWCCEPIRHPALTWGAWSAARQDASEEKEFHIRSLRRVRQQRMHHRFGEFLPCVSGSVSVPVASCYQPAWEEWWEEGVRLLHLFNKLQNWMTVRSVNYSINR